MNYRRVIVAVANNKNISIQIMSAIFLYVARDKFETY